MPFKIVRNDITKMKVDAIVNAANNTLLGGGGVDGAIHYAAGPDLYKECLTLGGCETGDAKITGAYRLPCKYIIHTVGPIWIDGKHGEREQLISCYRRSLQVARENGCETVAFPLISSGVYGYPKDKALKVASDTISEFLYENDMTVYLVIYSKAAYDIGEKLFNDIAAYIDDNYVERHTDTSREDMRRKTLLSEWEYSEKAKDTAASERTEEPRLLAPHEAADSIFKEVPEDAMLSDTSLNDTLNMLDEGFSEMLLRKIDERGMTDVECYKKANIDRKLFSKIRSNANYKPSKPTVLAFAIALELSLDETKELLMKAGFALSHSFKSDVIVEYFISRGIYDIFTINEALFAFDQTMLGA